MGTRTVWSFTLQITVNMQDSAQEAAGTIFSNAISSYHIANSLFDDTINCYSVLVVSAGAYNEVFTYKQALKEDDYHELIKAIVNKAADHEVRGHWTLMERYDMPPDRKVS